MNISDFINAYPTQIIITMMVIIIVLIILLILNIKNKEGFDVGIFKDVEFRSADNSQLCIHKTGDEKNFSSDRKLHWWNGALNHANSKHTLEYTPSLKLFNVSRIDPISNNVYRWNVYNYANGCCKQTNVGFYPSKSTAENEWFKFEWIDNETCYIKTKCGGNVGGTVAHDKDILAGSNVAAAKIKLYSYTLNRFLNKSDFGETAGGVFGALKAVTGQVAPMENGGIAAVGSTNSGVATGVATGVSVNNVSEKFNLMYKTKYLIPVKNGNTIYLQCGTSSPSQPQFACDSDHKTITIPAFNAVLRNIKSFNANQTTGEGKVVLTAELVGDGRYCRACTQKTSESRLDRIYLNLGEMPKYTCCGKDRRYYIPITELKIDRYVKV